MRVSAALSAPAAACLAAALLAACTSPEERFAQHVSRGEEYAAQDKSKKALLEYHSALKIQPENAEINERVGDLLRLEGAPDDAIFYYREAFRVDPERVGAALKEARLLLFSDPTRARELIELALAKRGDDATVYRALSDLELAQNDLDAAVAAARKSIELEPEDEAGWFALGKALQAVLRQHQVDGKTPSEEDFASAAEAFARSDELRGGYVTARLERARVLAIWPGHREQAKQAFRDSVELARTDKYASRWVVAANAAADFAEKTGDTEMQLWALREIVKASGRELNAWDRLARLTQREKGEGDAVYQELLSGQGDRPEAHILYANFLTEYGRGMEAIAHLEEVLADGVQSPLMWEQLLRLQLYRLQLSNARATFVRMADAFPDSPVTQRGEARLALVSGRVEASAEILRELVRERDDFETQRLLAVAEHRLGNSERALAAAERALVLAPGNFSLDVMELKARIHHDEEEWLQSLRAYEAIRLHGHKLDGDARLNRARALYGLGRRGHARQALVWLLRRDDAPPAAAVEYARREGARDPKGARAHLEAAFERRPSDYGVLRELTRRDVAGGKAQQALDRINGVIESQRVGPRILLLRAELLAAAGHFDEAEADALRAFEAAPSSTAAIDLLESIYVAQDRVAEARASFEEAEAAGVLHAGARLLLARLAARDADSAKARSLYEAVLADQPDSAAAQADLARLLAREGEDLDRAMELAREAHRARRTDAETAHVLGYVFLRAGRPEAALQHLRRSLRLAVFDAESAPDAELHYHMGLTLSALDRKKEAIRAFETALALDSDFADAEDARRQIDGLRRGKAAAANPS